ncbi:MAG: Bro-N domain-containing protein [Verrucomicrobiales bacterium]|nr:Bro-N domain-containing protein [Verrucomicrobiales bacterium]
MFENKKVRTHWDAETGEWYFSVIDVVAVLTDSANARDYWFKMKQRVRLEDGLQLSTICRQLKMPALDEKMRETDCADTQSLLRIIQSISSAKAEPFKQWLAKVGYSANVMMNYHITNEPKATRHRLANGTALGCCAEVTVGRETAASPAMVTPLNRSRRLMPSARGKSLRWIGLMGMADISFSFN